MPVDATDDELLGRVPGSQSAMPDCGEKPVRPGHHDKTENEKEQPTTMFHGDGGQPRP